MALSIELLRLRQSGLALLHGDGIEIGALHEPAQLPADAHVQYVDAISLEEAHRLFPEVDQTRLVTPSVITDLDKDGLACFPTSKLDFVVICHVLEHLANPIFALSETFRVLKPGGRAAIAIPDKRFTFDKPRALTPFTHLWLDFLRHAIANTDEHYLDFLRAVAPGVANLPAKELAEHLGRVRERREHAHVWDSESFRETLLISLPLCGYRGRLLYESHGDQNRFEYFSVWQKIG